MARQLMLVFSSALEGREAEYTKWYDEVHLPDVLKIPGVVAGQRWERIEGTGAQSPSQFVAVYEIEAEPSEVMAGLAEAGKSGQMQMTDAIDRSSVAFWFFKPGSARLEAAG